MFRTYYRRSGHWFVILPWWMWLVVALLWLVGFAAVCVLTLAWTLVRLPLVGIDKLFDHRPSQALHHWFTQPVNFDTARPPARPRKPKSERRTSEPGRYRL